MVTFGYKMATTILLILRLKTVIHNPKGDFAVGLDLVSIDEQEVQDIIVLFILPFFIICIQTKKTDRYWLSVNPVQR